MTRPISDTAHRLTLTVLILFGTAFSARADEEGAEAAEETPKHTALVGEGERLARETGAALVPAVLSIFERSCADCHDSARARPKGGFGNIMDLAAIRANPDYIVPGEPMESELYLLIMDPEPDFRMPPPDSDHPQLTRGESRLIEHWILAGAPASPYAATVEDEEAPDTTEIVDEAVADGAGTGFDFGKTFAKAHPLLVHFPIALLLAGILAEALRFTGLGGARLGFAASWCLWLGTAGAVFSVWSGWLNADVAGHSDEAVFFHRWAGVAVAVLATGLLGVRTCLRKKGKGVRLVLLALLILLLGGLIAAGHSGGELVYGEGYFSLFGTD